MAKGEGRNAPEEERARLLALFAETRARTEALAARLSPEDQQLQSMPDASPTKWHRAHTTWFFETFVLAPAGIAPAFAEAGFLFNSYYDAAGPRHARAKRGLLSRPSAAEVGDYRRKVDERVTKLVASASAAILERVLPIVELGIAHEEQHQELLLTDILHAFSESPLRPSFLGDAAAAPAAPAAPPAREIRFVSFDGGLREVGVADSSSAFAFDNERPRHKSWVEPFAIADRLVTMGELAAFVREGGYRTPSLWLAEGFDFVRDHGIAAPLHTTIVEDEIRVFTLAGTCVASPNDPVVHVSYYEADALARFLGARLPTEAEWEIAAAARPVSGNFLDDGILRPRPPAPDAGQVRQLFGDAWEWTASSYEAYPGYTPPSGALGEYNGKFMVNQRILRGGSCLTPRRHVRATYRNFWHPPTRFQMTGVRVARSANGGKP
jgi:ergothioneine biosynthesis protein EgtB